MDQWQPTFLFDVVHMGLASDAEFLADMARIQDRSSYWFEMYQTGKLGLNNTGRMSKAIQASTLLPFPGCALSKGDRKRRQSTVCNLYLYLARMIASLSIPML